MNPPENSDNPPLDSTIINQNDLSNNTRPVLVLKELVATLQKEQNKIQTLLSSLGFALRSFNNLNQFLELTPLMAARVTDAQGGALILYEKNDKVSLEQLYCPYNKSGQYIRKNLEKIIYQINLNQGKNSWEYKINLIQNNQDFSSFVEKKIKIALTETIKVFSTPILVKNMEKGRIYIFSTEKDYLWTETRKKLVQLIADQTSVAIANNELTAKLRSKERQDKELEIASEIQLRLLPRQCPKIKNLELAAKCQTANRVGGDYYDFIPVNDDQLDEYNNQNVQVNCQPWGIVIGDVMGKGVPAGLIMTMTRGMLRAEVLNYHSPARVLKHLNRVMYADLDNSHRFVTLFYSEYNPQTQILRYSNAAHNPPLLWQENTKKIKLLDTDGMLIGLDPDSHYEEDEIQLNLGDIIIYYTDGFTDAVNEKGERYDENNFLRTVNYACQTYQNAQDILNYIFTQVQKFIGGKNSNSDDMTLIVMQIKSNDLQC